MIINDILKVLDSFLFSIFLWNLLGIWLDERDRKSAKQFAEDMFSRMENRK